MHLSTFGLLDLAICMAAGDDSNRTFSPFLTSMLLASCTTGEGRSFSSTFTAVEIDASPRKDVFLFGANWRLALLNMVFAMGSVVSSTSDSDQNIFYYQRARQHLGLESLGSGHMETLQALTIMGGLYLHYRNRPNLASAPPWISKSYCL